MNRTVSLHIQSFQRARGLLAGLAVAGMVSSALAQPVTTPAQTPATGSGATTNAANSTTPPDTVIMNPFEVSSYRDEGFVAASAVAGGRLAIDLKDAPVAYSVLNREFLDALNITGLEQAADWAPNTTRVPDHGHENTWGGAVLVSSRGVSSFFAQRDFFQMQMDFDGYNMDRFDYGRGPNAVLFGFASFGGTQNVVAKQAQIGRTFGQTRFSYGSWDYRRATVDYNAPLGDKAAVRVNLLGQRAQGWRDGEFNNRQAFHLAGKYQLGRSTEIRGEFERGYFEINTPYHTYNDQILGWNGSTTYATRQATPGNGQAVGVVSYGNFAQNNHGNSFVYSPIHSDDAFSVMGMGRTTSVTGSSQLGGYSYVGPNNFSATAMTEGFNLPDDRYNLAINNSNFQLPKKNDRFGLTNDPLSDRYYTVSSLFLNHQIGNLYMELATNYSFNKRRANMHVYAGAGSNGINEYIDINQTLPDGSPNPMFLEPYVEGRVQRRKDYWRGRNYRLSAAYVMDNTRFGSYTFQAMIGSALTDRYYVSDNYQVMRFSDPADQNQGSEALLYRRYLNHPETFEMNLPTQVQYRDANGTVNTAPVGWIPGWNEENRRVDFAQASVRGRWFDGNLIGIASARWDDVYRQGRRTPNNRDLVGTGWDPSKPLYLPFISQEEWASLTYVPKDANGNPTGPAQPAVNVPRDAAGFRLPQYANDRFQTDFSPPPVEADTHSIFAGLVYHIRPWVSAAVNYSQGADYNDAPQRFDGSTFPMRESEGKDVSLRFTLLEGRLNTTVTYYEGEEKNEGINTGNLNIARWGSFNTILGSNVITDNSPNGINGRGVPLVVSPGWDSRIRKNHGVEFDTVANITRNWRMSLNFAFPKAVQEDTAPDFRNYFDTNESVLRQILADSGILVDSNGNASLDPAQNALRATNGLTDEHTQAANAWNAVYQDRQSIVTGAQDLARSMNFLANLYTDYRFASGPLRGFKVGGGFNYRGKSVIGYRGSDTIQNPANPAQAIDDPSVDAFDTVKTDAYSNVVLNFGYTWRHSEKLTFDIDLKIDNVFNDDDPIYVNTTLRPRDGNLNSPARVAVPGQYWWRQTPRNYTLSITAKF